jgi:lactoylglutathione lyase
MTNTSHVTPDFRIDHTMLRVSDLDKTLDFYVRILGMKILRQNEYPEGRFTNTFIGYNSRKNLLQ